VPLSSAPPHIAATILRKRPDCDRPGRLEKHGSFMIFVDDNSIGKRFGVIHSEESGSFLQPAIGASQ